MKKYEFLEHPADLKICAHGKTLPEMFVNAALGMMDFLYEISDAKTPYSETICVEAENIESLLVNWLSEILCLSDTNCRAYINYTIKEFSKTKIVAEVGSMPAKIKDDIKAVTYSELKITQTKNGWQAIFVCDV